MLASRNLRISRIFSQLLVRSYVSAPAVKPFHYQELLEHEKKIDTPYKKLTGISCVCVCIIITTLTSIFSIFVRFICCLLWAVYKLYYCD